MPSSGYIEFHCLAILENYCTVPDKPHTLLFDVILFGQSGKLGAATVGRFRFYNSHNLTFSDEGEECEITGRFALAQPGIETLSKTYGENDVKVVGDILTINRTPHAEVLTHQPCARITLAGTVENIFKSSASFTLNILQYISLFGKKSKPVVPIKCIIPKSPKWPEPAKLLPYPGTTVVCAGSYVGYEMEQVDDAEVLRIIVEIDVIEFLTPKFDPAAISSPTDHRSDKEQVHTTDPILAKSRYRQRLGRTSSVSLSPKVLGKRPMGPLDADDGFDTSTQQPSPKRQAESVVSIPTGGSDFSSD